MDTNLDILTLVSSISGFIGEKCGVSQSLTSDTKGCLQAVSGKIMG